MAETTLNTGGAAGRRMPEWLRTAAGFAAFFAVLVVAWDLWVRWGEVPTFVMPSPADTWAAFLTENERIRAALFYTMRSALIGLVVAAAVALSLASVFVSSQALSRAVLPLVIIVRTAPVLALAPILIMMFGRGLTTSIVVVVIVAFFPIMVNAMKGLRATPPNAMELMHVLGARGPTVFWKVRLPFALPFIFTGLRASAASAFLSAMLAEWMSGAPGLGTLILDAAAYYQLGLMWSAVVVSTLMAVSVFLLTSFLEHRVTAWT